ncbi:MAG: N-acetylneuraminate synthase family protein [gamma proteobacterium symbiont of Taylorina sp.]|nr:N-acetylneuraminate synthase family protein [gamma proteobacterium symbiont of Taylorina sp.]
MINTEMKAVKINNKLIGDGFPAYIIAEVGINHNGSVSLAKEMIQSAWEAGADAVKIQTFITKDFLHPSHPGYQYDIDAEISHEKEQEIWDFAKKTGVNLFSTPEEFTSLNFIKQQNPVLIKIAAMDFTYQDLIQEAASLNIPIILSSGMSTMEEVLRVKRWIKEVGNNQSIFLHCVSAYPTPSDACNLQAMQTMKQVLNCPVGFSDHTIGVHIPFAAVVMGANVIEKHYTLDKNLQGPDQRASMDSDDLRQLIYMVREFESSLGNGIKEPAEIEKAPKEFKRRGVYASKDIALGDSLSNGNVMFYAPSTATSKVENWDKMQGREVSRSIKYMDLISENDLY